MARVSQRPPAVPIALEQRADIAGQSKSGPKVRVQAGEAVRPAAAPGLEAQQHIDEQRHPDLPLHGDKNIDVLLEQYLAHLPS